MEDSRQKIRLPSVIGFRDGLLFPRGKNPDYLLKPRIGIYFQGSMV